MARRSRTAPQARRRGDHCDAQASARRALTSRRELEAVVRSPRADAEQGERR
jgi:hypothetical protein